MQLTDNLSAILAQNRAGDSHHRRMRLLRPAIVAGVLLAALGLGYRASPMILAGILTSAALALTLGNPALAIVALPWAAMYLPIDLKASTVVTINIAVVIAPLLIVAWLFRMVRQRKVTIIPSRLYAPMAALVLSASLSWVLGNLYWSPQVPRPANVLLVQMGQWSIFAFAMLAVVLGLNLVADDRRRRTVIVSYLLAGATAIVLYSIPQMAALMGRLVQPGAVDSTYWIWTTSLLLSILLFHRKLAPPLKAGILIVLVLQWRLALLNSVWMSGMVPMAATTVVLGALRLRKKAWLLLPVLAVVGFLAFPTIREQLNLDQEFQISGLGRLTHIRIVLMFALDRPWFGLGMAAYRHYIATVPQVVKSLLFAGVGVSTHNNYIDIFAHMGIVGLLAFTWLAATLGRELFRASLRHREGFTAIVANAGCAAFAGILVSGMLGDWFFPFVYNIGFKGMRSVTMAWILLGAAAGLARITPGPGFPPDQAIPPQAAPRRARSTL